VSDFFDISGETIKAAEAAAEFKMVVPETAKVTKRGDSVWDEHGTIKAAFSEALETIIEGRKCPILLLQADISVDAEGSGKNAGYFPVRFKARMNSAAIGSNADKATPMGKQATMTRISIARLKGMLSAANFEPDLEDGGYSQGMLASLFPPVKSFTGEVSPLVGINLWFQVKQGESEGRDGGKFTNIEVERVISGDV